jgi:penicillin-binding protein-related factor A (putative recombinase)
MPSLPSPRSRAGALAKAAGAAFEHWVEAQHGEAVRLGFLAMVTHLEPAVIATRHGIIRKAPSGPDYMGCLADSRAYCCEAKTCSGPRFERARISPLQSAHLDAVSSAGGLALLLLEFREEKAALWTIRRFAGCWEALPWERARTAETLTAAGMAAAGCELAGGCYLAKFMDTARAGV